MTLKKKILKSPIVISIAAWLVAQYIRLVYHTTKWEKVNAGVLIQNKPYLGAIWHGRLLMIPSLAPKNMKKNVVISNHSDGELIAKVQRYLDVNPIRGSSSNGGVSALREVLRKVRAGESVAITPDGPRGPARKVNGTIIDIAKKLDIPIIPATFSCGKHSFAKSWDKFMVAKPFGKGILVVGNPIYPSDKDFGAQKLEDELNRITDEADLAVKTL